MKPRTGRTPDVLRKGGAHRDRTKYHRPDSVEFERSQGWMECNYCSEIALPVEGGECSECGTPQYF